MSKFLSEQSYYLRSDKWQYIGPPELEIRTKEFVEIKSLGLASSFLLQMLRTEDNFATNEPDFLSIS